MLGSPVPSGVMLGSPVPSGVERAGAAAVPEEVQTVPPGTVAGLGEHPQ